MPYSVSQVVWTTPTNLGAGGTRLGLPTSFRYLLFSYWVCMGNDAGARSISFVNSALITLTSSWSSGFPMTLTRSVGTSPIFDGTFAHAFGGFYTHVLVSIDSVAGKIQCYANDQPLSVSSGGWTGATLGNMDLSSLVWANWSFPSVGAPGIGDFFVASPTSFFDLTVELNRRKFINADLTAVDVLADGSGPFGASPPIYLTARSGTADDFAVNNGTGGSFTITNGPLAFEPAGFCDVPPPPDDGGDGGGGGDDEAARLMLDDVIVTTQARQAGCMVYLDWSDDRGHSYGHPVGQTLGGTGNYMAVPSWNRLGYARDRVFRLTWSCATPTALQGAFIDFDPRAKT